MGDMTDLIRGELHTGNAKVVNNKLFFFFFCFIYEHRSFFPLLGAADKEDRRKRDGAPRSFSSALAALCLLLCFIYQAGVYTVECVAGLEPDMGWH